jgi:methyl-accepting chemotaxis protein
MNVSLTKWLSQVLSDPFCFTYLLIQSSIFLYFFIHVLFPINHRTRRLAKIIKLSKKQNSNDKPLPEIRLSLQDSIKKVLPWAYEGFQEFKTAWSESRIGEDAKAASPIRIKEFLPQEIVLDRVRNQRLPNALPGIFVSIGIFGTFLGLVMGLSEVNLSDVDNLKIGVEHLISGLSLAFSSSLLGILYSVLFSFFYKMKITRLETTFFSFDEVLSKFFPYHSAERFSGQYLETQMDIKHSMQTLATDIVTKLGPKIGEAIGKELDPLRYDFSLLLENLQKTNAAASKGLVELFDNKFRELFQELSVIVKETTIVQSEIKSQMENFAENLEKHFAGQAELIEKTSKAGQILSDSLGSLENISNHLNSSADHVTSAATLLEESAAKAKDGHEILCDTMEKQVEAFTKTREELTASWENITDNTEGIVELMRLTIGELEEGVGKNLLKALEAFDGKVAEVAERFSGTLFENSEIINELPGLLGELNETFQSIGSEIMAQKEAIQELTKTTKDVVAPNINEAVQAAYVLKDSSEELVKIKTDLHDLFGEAIPTIQSNFGFLGPESPIIKQLNTLNEKLNGGGSKNNGEHQNFEQIEQICRQLGQIKTILETNRANENSKENKQILESVHALNEKIYTISKHFNENLINTLQESLLANIKTAQNFDELKTTFTNETLSQSSKKNFFGRMLNK